MQSTALLDAWPTIGNYDLHFDQTITLAKQVVIVILFQGADAALKVLKLVTGRHPLLPKIWPNLLILAAVIERTYQVWFKFRWVTFHTDIDGVTLIR